MKFNQKLINDLREGKIVLENRPKDSGKVRAILNEAFPKQGYTQAYYGYYFAIRNNIHDYECTDVMNYAQSRGTIVPIADFILPEPKFKVGDGIVWGCEEKTITESRYDGHYKTWFHRFKENGDVWHNEEHMKPTIQFTVGNQYEFSDGEDWVKGKAVGTVDCEGQRNFVAEIGGKLSVFESIRPIQPVKIERWANVFPSGYISDRIYSTEVKAKKNGNSDCKQVKLEGTYTF